LSQLSDKSFTITAARFLLFLLFLVIECLPVTVKLLQQPGNYEKILQAVRERELADAKRSVRTNRMDSPASDPAAGGRRSSTTDDDGRQIWAAGHEYGRREQTKVRRVPAFAEPDSEMVAFRGPPEPRDADEQPSAAHFDL